MELRFHANFPSAPFHLDPELIDQFTNAMGPFLLLGILEAIATGISVTGVHNGHRVWQGTLGSAEGLVHIGFIEGSLGMKSIDRHTKVVRVVVFEDGDAMGTLGLDKIVSQFHGSVENLKRRLLSLMRRRRRIIARLGSFVRRRSLAASPPFGLGVLGGSLGWRLRSAVELSLLWQDLCRGDRCHGWSRALSRFRWLLLLEIG